MGQINTHNGKTVSENVKKNNLSRIVEMLESICISNIWNQIDNITLRFPFSTCMCLKFKFMFQYL